MKDDLISRKAAIDRLNTIPPGNWSKARYTRELWNVPSVEAVPLDKLCEFLEKCGADSYCGTCKQIMGGCITDGNGCGSEHFWKELLTKWKEETANDAE